MEEPQHSQQPHKLQKNQLLELSVTNLAFGGAGIAKIGEFVVFVTGAVPGDVVRARITKQKKRYAEARAEQIITPSPDRIPHRCPSFGCGGCVWQGLDYGLQPGRCASPGLGGLRDFELLPIVGMPDPWRYRNRADFSIGMADQGAVIGFRPPGRWDLVLPISECHLLGPSRPGRRWKRGFARRACPAGIPVGTRALPGTCLRARRRTAPSSY